MAGQLPYSEKVMDHFMNPRNVGEISDASGIGTVGNPICGDVMKMFLKIENDIIVDVKFKTFGCLPAEERIVLSEGGWKEISNVTKGKAVVNSEGKEVLTGESYKRNYNSTELLKLQKIANSILHNNVQFLNSLATS